MQVSENEHSKIVDTLASGGVIVMRSDTIYGIFASANNKDAVLRIRDIKDRSNEQAFLVVCANTDQIKELSGIDDDYLSLATNYWPGKVTVIFKPNKTHPHIQGDPEELSFRIPDDTRLRDILEQTGPLVAPSANPRGLEPAKNINEAQKYFGDSIDLYVNGGTVENARPSKVLKINPNGTEEIFRD